jgi:hypothetical protein
LCSSCAAAELELSSLRTAAEKVVSYFYSDQAHAASQVPELLSAAPDKARELMKKKMLRASSLTLGVLKSLYPRANFDIAGEGFAKDCEPARAAQLVKDSVAAATEIIEMIKLK